MTDQPTSGPSPLPPVPPGWTEPPTYPPPGYPPGAPPAHPAAYGLPPHGQPYGQTYGQPYGQPYGQAQSRRTNGLAIASMVLGILWIYWLGSILALVFGYVARRQIRERGEAGEGMAIAGIVLGWVGVAIATLLVVLAVAVRARVSSN